MLRVLQGSGRRAKSAVKEDAAAYGGAMPRQQNDSGGSTPRAQAPRALCALPKVSPAAAAMREAGRCTRVPAPVIFAEADEVDAR